jgi:hypothetical protein
MTWQRDLRNVFVVWLFIAAMNVQAMPPLPYPKGATVGVVGDAMVVNGLPSRVRELRWKGHGQQELVDFYASRLLRRQDAKPMRVGDTVILSGMLHATYVTVMTHETKGVAYAKLMQADLTRPARMDIKTLAPLGSQMLTHVESMDGGRHATTLMYANRHSSEANVDFVVARMAPLGFKVTGRAAALSADQPGPVVALEDGRGGHVMVTVMPKKGHHVVTIQSMASIAPLANAAGGRS